MILLYDTAINRNLSKVHYTNVSFLAICGTPKIGQEAPRAELLRLLMQPRRKRNFLKRAEVPFATV